MDRYPFWSFSNESHIRPNDCWPTSASRRLIQGHICQIFGCCLSFIISGLGLAPCIFRPFMRITHTQTHARTHRGSPLKGHKVKLKINQKQNGGRGAQIDVDISKSATLSGLLAQHFFCIMFFFCFFFRFREAACNL